MFDLAKQMLSLGQHVQLLTAYPRFKVDPDLRPVAHTRSRYLLLQMARHRLRPRPRTTWWQDLTIEDFGPWVARTVESPDILDALSGTGREAGRRLHAEGRPWVCNRGSSHILAQKEILDEEHRRLGIPPPYFDMGRPLERCLGEYAEADAIVVPSSFARRTFLERGVPAEKVAVCPYGVDNSLFAPQRKEDARFRAIFVGTYSIRKGIGYLFEAVRPLVAAGHAELWLVGGPHQDALGLLRKNGGVFADKGFQPRNRLSWFMSQASVLVLPSVEEGLALVQAQAMACGVPVIATPNTGAEDLFTDGREGFIVPARDPGAIRERLDWMIAHPRERAIMGEAALARVKEIGGWRDYGQRCLAVYRDVIAARGAATTCVTNEATGSRVP